MAAELPILQFEEKIIETVKNNSVVVIIGETGSGKSTQLSQMLHRRGYTSSGIVSVTQPHRVAAVSVARRVSQELDVRLGDEVGFAIRFEDRTSDRTRSKSEVAAGEEHVESGNSLFGFSRWHFS